MANKYEQIVLKEFTNRKKDASTLKDVIGGLISTFSGDGILSKFTDAITGDSAAKAYTSDPIGQRIFQDFSQPAVMKAKKGDLAKSFQLLNKGLDRLEYYIENYKLNLGRYTGNSYLKKIVDSEKGDAWQPEQIIGMPFSKSLARTGRPGYSKFPQPYEFQKSIFKGAQSIFTAVQVIIGTRFDEILSDPVLAEEVYMGLGDMLQKMDQLSLISFTVESDSDYSRYRSSNSDFDLSDLPANINKNANNVISDLLEFMKLLKSASGVIGNIQNQRNNDNIINVDQLTNEVIRRISEMYKGKKVRILITEKDLEEQSVVGGIAGYSLPLGASNQEDPDKEMDDQIKGKKSNSTYKWDDLSISNANISDKNKKSFKKGTDFLFKGRKPRS